MQEFLQNVQWAEVVPQVVGQFLGFVFGIIATWFLVFRKRLRALEAIHRGDTDIVLFQMHVLYPVGNRFALLFRNACPSTTINELYHNAAAQDEVRRLAEKTSLQDPILDARNSVGFEIVNGAFSEIAGHLATTPFPREVWLFAMTSEDRSLVKRRCIRCFLIRQEDLEQFADWNWCRNMLVCEKPWHWVRIVTLHRIAMQWKNDGAEDKRSAKAMPSIDTGTRYRIWQLSAGINRDEVPIGEPIEIPWEQHEETLRKLGLDVATGEAIR